MEDLITNAVVSRFFVFCVIAIDHANPRIQYWKNPGPFAGAGLEPDHPRLDQFLGVIVAIVQAAYGFAGMEVVRVPFVL